MPDKTADLALPFHGCLKIGFSGYVPIPGRFRGLQHTVCLRVPHIGKLMSPGNILQIGEPFFLRYGRQCVPGGLQGNLSILHHVLYVGDNVVRSLCQMCPVLFLDGTVKFSDIACGKCCKQQNHCQQSCQYSHKRHPFPGLCLFLSHGISPSLHLHFSRSCLSASIFARHSSAVSFPSASIYSRIQEASIWENPRMRSHAVESR